MRNLVIGIAAGWAIFLVALWVSPQLRDEMSATAFWLAHPAETDAISAEIRAGDKSQVDRVVQEGFAALVKANVAVACAFGLYFWMTRQKTRKDPLGIRGNHDAKGAWKKGKAKP